MLSLFISKFNRARGPAPVPKSAAPVHSGTNALLQMPMDQILDAEFVFDATSSSQDTSFEGALLTRPVWQLLMCVLIEKQRVANDESCTAFLRMLTSCPSSSHFI